ncbi:MAG: hypothetical protein ACI8VT_003987 [Saprospiraceae bacterium]|jgi:hypothetical protein
MINKFIINLLPIYWHNANILAGIILLFLKYPQIGDVVQKDTNTTATKKVM